MGHTVPGGAECGQCIHNQGPGAGGVFSHYVEKAQCEDRWEEVTPHSSPVTRGSQIHIPALQVTELVPS